MTNIIVTCNPFGELSLNELDEFEKKLGVSLPEQYRNYLIHCNGGIYEKDIIKISDREGDTRIHHILGLHDGPDYAQLDINTPLINDEFLAICDDSFGNKFLIKLKGEARGSIYYFDHEVQDFRSALTKVAEDYAEFVGKMKNRDEAMSEFKTRDPAGYTDFKKRLEALRRQREEEK